MRDALPVSETARAAVRQEPVDPLLIEAREIMALCCEEWGESGRAERYRIGDFDGDDEMGAAVVRLRRVFAEQS